MQIASAEVFTPFDKAYAYDMSWRHEAAIALGGGSGGKDIVHTLVADDYLFTQMKYLDLIQDDVFEDCLDSIIMDRETRNNVLRDVAEANRIHQTTVMDHTSERLEAMLLCPEFDYAVIGREFGLMPGVVRAFEKLFFNIRDDEGKMLGCTGLLMYATLRGAVSFDGSEERNKSHPSHWRVLAFEGGYKPLYAIWGWKAKGDMTNLTFVDLTADMMRNTYRQMDKVLRFNDRIDVRALAQILTTLNQQFADLRKSGILSDKDEIDPNAMILEVIKLLAPERLIETEDTLKLAQKDLDGKLAAVMAKEGRSQVGDKPAAFKHIEAQLNKGVDTNV